MRFQLIGRDLKLADIATKLGGRVVGNAEILIKGLCSLDEPKPAHLSLYTKESKKDLSTQLNNSEIGAVLVREGTDFDQLQETTSLLYVKDPIASLVAAIKLFFESIQEEPSISPLAAIHPSVKFGKNVTVGPFSVIGTDSEIGDNVVISSHVVIYPCVKIGQGSLIHSGATIRENCQIGKNSVIQNGAIIGADGFGYYFDGKKLAPVPQVGIVKLNDGVEVGANSCIDRATIGTTEIGPHTKLDNLVQVGHNVKIGSMSILCGQVGVGGSCNIGNNVTLGGQVGVADHIEIGDKIRFAGQSGVSNNCSTPGDYAGMPAIPAQLWKRQMLALRKLPAMVSSLTKLKRSQGLPD